MADVHIKRNIVTADYTVVPDTLIHLILKGKILTFDGQSESLVSTTLLRPSIHLSTVCDLFPGSRSVAILNCHSFVYCANYNTAHNRFRITGVAVGAFCACSHQVQCATELPVVNRR
jgi:hypothetical protein